MPLAKSLQKEPSNVAQRLTTTFNAPGNYQRPYGKTVVQVGGKGNPGVAPVPGTPGNVSGSNSPNPTNGIYREVGLNRNISYVPNNTPPVTITDPPITNGNLTTQSYYSRTPNTTTSEFRATNNSVPFSVSAPAYYAYNVSDANSSYYEQVIYNLVNVTPGTPGTPNYNPSNPTVPGNNGTPTTVLGVPFPGGTLGVAATVPDTPVQLAYSNSGVTVTVPSGGFVTIKNIYP